MVTDALKLIDNVVHHQEVAQVTGHRALSGDGGGDGGDDLVLHVVDLPVADDHRRGLLGVVGDERIEGVTDRRLRHAPHADNRLLDVAQFPIKRLAGTLGRRRGSVGRGAREDLLDLALDSTLIVSCCHFPSELLK